MCSLGLKYINWVTSVKNCLETLVEKPPPSSLETSADEKNEKNDVVSGEGAEELGGTIDLSKIDDAHIALRLEIERSIRVFKKMKDDAVFDLNDVVYDKLLLAALPNNLVTEAIAAQLQMDELCQKRK